MRQAEKFRNFAGAASQTEKAMDVEEFRAYCLSLSGVTEQMPFTVPKMLTAATQPTRSSAGWWRTSADSAEKSEAL